MIWFTSDTHFGHKFQAEKRGFSSTEEMDSLLIERFNSVVSPHDDVYHCGDFSFHNFENTKRVLLSLNGQFHLVRGNHDNRSMWKKLENLQQPIGLVTWVRSIHSVRYNKEKVILCHFPFEVWDRCHKGSWHLHGHSHGSLIQERNLRRMDVGVDTNNFFPYSFDDVKKIMESRGYDPVDHHC